ncbi:MAG: phosphatase PAP2 family protein [Bacilli bacterium]|nr:phosphatase PAP2 family protein [Bacilli bacterium]MDY6430935.1 phosphatase PAP2 family protein [Bacilli bacterium]
MKKVERIIVYLALIAVFVIAIFLDKKITMKIYDPVNGFGRTFELIGEMPGYVVAVMAGAIGFKCFDSDRKNIKIIGKVIFAIAIIGGAGYAGYNSKGVVDRLLGEKLSFAFVIPFVLGYLAAGCGLGYFLSRGDKKEALRFAYIALIVFIVVLAASTAIKFIWFRPRYRTLVALYGENAGNYWRAVYKPQTWKAYSTYMSVGDDVLAAAAKYLGIDKVGRSEFLSFPSGHTFSAMYIVVLAFSGNVFPFISKRKNIWKIVAFLFAIVVGLSRMVTGAHNATDVLASIIMVILVTDLAFTFLPKFADKLVELPFKHKEVKAEE